MSQKVIEKVAVVGAGVMGAGIAAQIANAGLPVLLFDVSLSAAQAAIGRLKKSNPAPLMHPDNAALITPLSTETDLSRLAEADWIIEAIVERLDVKQALYHRIAAVRKTGALVSSNTSTIPLAELTSGLPKAFAEHFLITHFFNPPRYLRLLEWVTAPGMSVTRTNHLRSFISEKLGKTVVPCHDTPGFIANRIGTYWMFAAITGAFRHGLSVEAADAVLGKPMGVPKTGIFGLVDLVGLDLMPHVIGSLKNALPASDALHTLGSTPALLETMIAKGLTGKKGPKNGAGFYRRDEHKKRQAIDLATGDYLPLQKPRVKAVIAGRKAAKKSRSHGLRTLVTHPSPAGRYAWEVISGTLVYAAELLGPSAQGGIADTIVEADTAMRLGYNWTYGPFELLDQLGAAWFVKRLLTEGRPVPAFLARAAASDNRCYRVNNGQLEHLGLDDAYHPVVREPGTLLLADIKRRSKPLMQNISARVWDAGDGIAVLELRSKMNALDPFILHLLSRAMDKLPGMGFRGLVIHNSGEGGAKNFSVGANLLMLQVTAKLRLWPLINLILRHGQTVFQRMKYHPMPIVAAPQGMALGGGAELLLHSQAVVAGAETYIGLVEAGVGIIPGWGGCKELLGRAFATLRGGPMPAIAKTFETIATAKIATSAQEARNLLFLQPSDDIVMNPDHILARAKARALAMANARAAGYTVPKAHNYTLPGASAAAALNLALNDFALKGIATPHDIVVGRALARALSGGGTDITAPPLSEDQLLALEREGLLNLAKTGATRARIGHLLRTGKPLRN